MGGGRVLPRKPSDQPADQTSRANYSDRARTSRSPPSARLQPGQREMGYGRRGDGRPGAQALQGRLAIAARNRANGERPPGRTGAEELVGQSQTVARLVR